MPRLKKRDIDAAQPISKRNVRLWDDDPRGFGVYVKPSGVKSFFVQYRSPVTAKKRRYTIGPYGRLTLDQARIEAKDILGRVAKGEDPLRTRAQDRQHARATARTISELCDDYMRDAEAGLVTYRRKPKRASTLAVDRGRIERHIKPLLGENPVSDVTKRDVERVMHAVRLGKTSITVKTGPRGRAIVKGGPTAANRVVSLLGSIFTYAVKQGIRSDNPAWGIERPVDGKRDRVLSPDEYRQLGKALDDLERRGANRVAVRAYRVLALTGCRRGEVYGLKKPEVDAHNQCLRLGDTKAGRQVRAIGRGAMDLLTLPPFSESSEYVFPSVRGSGNLTDTKVFLHARETAGLERVSLHTLRHSFASVALELEYSEMTIAGLLGHRLHTVTSRYAHHVDRALVAAADRISAVIASRMAGEIETGGQVVPLSGRAG